MRELVTQKLLCFPQKNKPCCKKPTTLANPLSHELTTMFVYVTSAGNFP